MNDNNETADGTHVVAILKEELMNKVRIRHGEQEIEIEGPDKFIDEQLKKFYDRIDVAQPAAVRASIKDRLLETPTQTKSGKVPTPAEFYKSKAKGRTDGVKKILIFGKYLEEFRNQTEFSRGDINGITTEAKLSKDIHAQYFTNGVKQGLLRKLGRTYSLTLSAEEAIAAM